MKTYIAFGQVVTAAEYRQYLLGMIADYNAEIEEFAPKGFACEEAYDGRNFYNRLLWELDHK